MSYVYFLKDIVYEDYITKKFFFIEVVFDENDISLKISKPIYCDEINDDIDKKLDPSTNYLFYKNEKLYYKKPNNNIVNISDISKVSIKLCNLIMNNLLNLSSSLIKPLL
jgi:hypothetical protein